MIPGDDLTIFASVLALVAVVSLSILVWRFFRGN